MKLAFVLVALGLASPAIAQNRPVTAEEFLSYTEKWTLYFSRGGLYYGAEQFYGRRRTTLLLANGECLDGIWYMEGPKICFEYEDPDSPHCWVMSWRSQNIFALPAGSDDPARSIEVYRRDKTPLDCKPPDFGS